MLIRSSRRPLPVAMAFDRASVRSTDEDGRLHVELTPISKANVCPYRGSEISDWERHGLDPNAIYQLYRDPEELAKAVATFNNLPLLNTHYEVSAEDPRPDLVVGSTGESAVFKAPYLLNSLVIWREDAIAGIESDTQREISCAYRYDYDPTPGEVDGVKFHGVMRNLRGSHAALVEAGRAGPDILVGDSIENLRSSTAIKETPMAKLASRKALLLSGALGVYLRPKLAMDAKIDLSGIVAGITRKNFAAKKAGIASALAAKTKGKLAADADLGDLDAVLEAVADLTDGDAEDDDLDQAMDEGEPTKKDDESDEEFAKRMAAWKETDAGKAKTAKDEEDAAAKKKAEDDAAEPKVTKAAMDAALKAVRLQATKDAQSQARKDARELRDAEEAVKPYVGAVVAMDSAEDVLRFAIEKVAPDVDLDGVPASALLSILKAHPVPGSQTRRIAMDSASVANAEAELALMTSTSNARS